MGTHIYMAGDKATLITKLRDALREVEQSGEFVSVTIYGEGNSTVDQAEWQLEFSNDDMERYEMAGRIVFDVEAF